MYLIHHGVKGMKWGIRRYQNPDGSLTQEGKKHLMYRNRVISANKTNDAVNSIVDSMPLKERGLILGGNANPDDKYIHNMEEGSAVAHRVLKKIDNLPVAFFDIWDDGNQFNVALGTRSGIEYRNKGYAKEVAAKGIAWYEKNKSKFDDIPIVWGVHESNKGSIKIAKDMGFKYEKGSRKDGWVNYVK